MWCRLMCWLGRGPSARALAEINLKLERIMQTQTELAGQLTTVTDQLKKIQGEVSTLLTKIDDLTTAVANAPVTPELQAAADALAAQAKVVDDLVPDA